MTFFRNKTQLEQNFLLPRIWLKFQKFCNLTTALKFYFLKISKTIVAIIRSAIIALQTLISIDLKDHSNHLATLQPVPSNATIKNTERMQILFGINKFY